MKLELCNGSYFILDDKTPYRDQEYYLRMWLYRNGFEGNIERRLVYTPRHSYSSFERNPGYVGKKRKVNKFCSLRNLAFFEFF